jgi:tagatose 6-phosphate kinase
VIARVITVTANAAIDRTLTVPALAGEADQPGASVHEQAGGKGVNVARVLHRLGCPVRAIAVLGGAAGDWCECELAESGIGTRVVPASGETRTCLEWVERGTARVRQEHGPGVIGDAALAERLMAAVAEELDGACWLAICGSAPQGLPAETFAALVSLARERGVRSALDTSQPALAPAWAARPDLVRVNRAEARDALGGDPEAGAEALAVITDGAAPFWARAGSTGALRITPPRVRLRNPIGCGDAMMAGLLARLRDGVDARSALRFATALAAAEAESACAGRPDPERALALEDAVLVEADFGPGVT